MDSLVGTYISVANSRVFGGGAIFEMCFDMPPETEKTEKYQWVLLLDKKRFYLDFVSADFSLGTRILKFTGGKDIFAVNLSLTENTLSLIYKDHIIFHKLSI